REHVVSAELNIRCEVEFERGVTIRPATDKLSVEPDRGVSHSTVNVEIKLFSFVLRRDVEVFPIPAHTPPGKLPRLTRIVLIERPFDAPVVRQIQLPPTAIIEAALRVRD